MTWRVRSPRRSHIGACLGWTLLVGGCQPPPSTDRFAPVRGSFITVDTDDDEKPGIIMNDVGAMLAREPIGREQLLSQGYDPPTGYLFKMRRSCAAARALVALVSAEIRKTTDAPISCFDGPPPRRDL